MALVLDACAQPASSPECSRHVERRKSGDHQATIIFHHKLSLISITSERKILSKRGEKETPGKYAGP